MKSLPFKFLFAVCLVAPPGFVQSGAIGQEPAKKAADPTALIKLKVKAARLPADKLEQANKIGADHAVKIADAEAKRDAVLTPQQRQMLTQAASNAAKGGKESGKTPQEVAADMVAALKGLNLTAEQLPKFTAAR